MKKWILLLGISILLSAVSFTYAEIQREKFISSKKAFEATDPQFETLWQKYRYVPGYGVSRTILNWPNEKSPYFLIKISVDKEYEIAPHKYERKEEFSQYLYVHPYTGKVYTDKTSLEHAYRGSTIIDADASQLEVKLEKKIPIDFDCGEYFIPSIDWSSDGKRIIFSDIGDKNVYSANVETGILDKLISLSRFDWEYPLNPPKTPYCLCCSPDGKRIGFVLRDEIWQMDANGKNAQRLYRFNQSNMQKAINELNLSPKFFYSIENLIYSCNGEKLIAIFTDSNRRSEPGIIILDIKTKRASFYKGEEAKKKIVQFSGGRADKIKLSHPTETSFLFWEASKAIYLTGAEVPILYAENIHSPHHAVRLYHFREGSRPLGLFWSSDGKQIIALMRIKRKLVLYSFSVEIRTSKKL